VPEGKLYKRAKGICKSLGNPEFISVEATKSFIGGGGLPETVLPSVALVFSKEQKTEELLAAFRQLDPPVIGRIENDRLILDLKAIDKDEVTILESSIRQVLPQLPK
jgi:L-seryl-tRNA(Ser) seleniumtransferase